MIGTCHSEQLKPAVLRPKHLRLYDLHLARGLTRYPPDILSAMLTEGRLRLDQEGALLLPEVSPARCPRAPPCGERRVAREGSRGGVLSGGAGLSQRAWPQERGGTSRHGGPRRAPVPGRGSLPPPLRRQSHQGPAQPDVDHRPGLALLRVPPVLRPAPPQKHRLQGHLRPLQHNTLHAAQLECFAWYKVLRDHRLVEEPTLCPPWCVTVRVSGHSFQPGCEHFTPRFSLQRPLVVFPALAEVCYRTVLLQNEGDLPLAFRLGSEGTPSVSAHPPSGLVRPGAHQILSLRAVPQEDPARALSVSVQFNASPKYTQTHGGGLQLGPLSRLTNTSRLPLRFHWRIPSPDGRVLSVQPESGVLLPNEARVLKWSFSPLAEMQYTLRPCLTFWPTQLPGSKKSRLFLQVVGLASTGSLQAEQAVTDLGQLLAGSCQSCDLPLINDGPCPLSFSLEVKQCIVGPGLEEDSDGDAVALQLGCHRGTVPARSRMVLRSTVRPACRAQYCWTISYRILSSSGSELAGPAHLCQVKAEGVFPVLQVTDVRGSGGVAGLSKLQLWGLFSLDALNAYLRRDPTPPELTYRVPTRHSLQGSPCFLTPVLLDFSFSAAPLGSEASSVLLMLENPGSIPVDWCFLFPEDQQLELECWAESVEFSPAELQQMKLNFLGVTVERDRPYVHFPSSRHTFTPVPIGGFSPPKQVYELYNGGAVPVRFHIDTAPLERLTEENFGHPVLQCLTPRGEVQPGRTASLEWIFSPLEAKTYTVDVPVHVLEGDSALVRFEGRGWDGRSGRCPQRGSRAAPLCAQHTAGGLTWAEERVSLGDIPVCSRSTRILFLTNVSLTERVLYTWNLPQDRSQQVQVVPDSGLLDAGQSALCILTLQASGTPSFYLLDLICQVTTERAMAQHEDELQRWEKERERQGNEFTFTEQGIEPPAHALLEKDAPTLPPICSSDGDLFGVTGARPSREERRARGRAARVWRRPELPRPFLLHLGVTARSHSHLEFQSCFPSRLNTHYIHR
ncbi:hypothetical protein ANANG_G00280930 [Anguilla anguilla]|uniref:Abnormal spindle-like microcephaly-associated protein ASH domain-containing protein n=1 Tax=Anguilla anguilla TaxID=7936 RepID=A0A9D3RKV6_ANGAN|nr:hypothetical protein ANANG_G00280930 [Anguilla anguilla]